MARNHTGTNYERSEYFGSLQRLVDALFEELEEEYEKKRTSGTQIVRATIAEIVDFREHFETKDKESEKVVDFLEQISPEQYVRKLADSNRRIDVSK